jgi:hypothetical protein
LGSLRESAGRATDQFGPARDRREGSLSYRVSTVAGRLPRCVPWAGQCRGDGGHQGQGGQ